MTFVFNQSDTRKGAYSASHISLANGPPTSFCIQSVSYKKRSIFSFVYFPWPMGCPLPFVFSQSDARTEALFSFVYFPKPMGCPLPFVFSQSDARKGAYSASYIFLSPWAAHFFLCAVNRLQAKEHIQLRIFSLAHGLPTFLCIQSIRCKKRSIFSFVYFPEPMGRPLLFVFSQSATRKGAYSASFIFLGPWAAHFLLYSVYHKNIN